MQGRNTNMAAFSSGENLNAEMRSSSDGSAMDLNDFVRGREFPQCVCITEGNYISKAVQISRGDVLLLKSCDSDNVTLSYQDETSRSWKDVNISINCNRKFVALPPKDTSSDKRVVSMVTYPTIADLLLDCPTYFEATCSYDDPYLPGISIKAGDRFRFIELVKDPKDNQDRLKVKDEVDNVLILTPECRGNFCPITDTREYTLRQLVDFAPVQRRLKLVSNSTHEGPGVNKGDVAAISSNQRNQNECSDIQQFSSQDLKPSSSSPMCSTNVSPVDSLPKAFTGVFHLQKPELMVAVSPFNDTSTTWKIPASANIKVRIFSHNDYETPAPRPVLKCPRVPLPLTMDEQMPRFQAPAVPAIPQPLIPVNVNNFSDIYCNTFPVKAAIFDTAEANPFFQELLKHVDEIYVYRLDEVQRLYVKDVKNDNVYSLAHDLRLSFIEYPEKFSTVSELLHLPLGTQVTVLEEIAADFPQPFSLRFGDVIRITSNTAHTVKMKHVSRDCEILKCEKVEPEDGEPSKLKLPMDFEVEMVMTTDPQSKKMISIPDLLAGTVAVPSQNVASVPEDPQDENLEELPVDLRILKPVKEACLVVAPVDRTQLPPSHFSSSTLKPSRTPSSKNSAVSNSADVKAGASSTNLPPVSLSNVGLPLTCGIVMAFRDRLELSELDVAASEADYIRLPVEKITLAQFEEREQLRKLSVAYEDIEFGSSNTLDECGAGGSNMLRANSTGLLERKQRQTKMDKVRRISKALNPKHWRHSKAEPEPLPHPSAMGLMALSARQRETVSNEYQQQQIESSSSRTSSTKSGSLRSQSTPTEPSSDEDADANVYEDVEIGPIKSSTIPTPTQERQAGSFSGPQHKSMPLPRMPAGWFSRNTNMKDKGTPVAPSVDQESQATKEQAESKEQDKEPHIYDVPHAFSKAKNWAANIGTNISNKFQNMKPRYDVPKNNKPKEDLAASEGSPRLDASKRGKDKKDSSSKGSSPGPGRSKEESTASGTLSKAGDSLETGGATLVTESSNSAKTSSKPPKPPPPLVINKRGSEKDKAEGIPPVPPARRKCGLTSTVSEDSKLNQETKGEIPNVHQSISKSMSLSDSISASGNVQVPTPKPRSLRQSKSGETENNPPTPAQRSPGPFQLARDVQSLAIDSNKTERQDETPDANEAARPKPPPKPRSLQTTV